MTRLTIDGREKTHSLCACWRVIDLTHDMSGQNARHARATRAVVCKCCSVGRALMKKVHESSPLHTIAM
ncbi:MAG TPA: hypothetical protein VNG89_10615 [Vicinamibacterales bacterium]|nr:hypothetical protein [Vicinamibacterales bacterium]